MTTASRMGRVAVYGVAGLATAAIGATAANAFVGDSAPAAAPPAAKNAPAPAAVPTPAPKTVPKTAPKAVAPAKVAAPEKKATPAKKVRVAPAAVHRTSATHHRVAKAAAHHRVAKPATTPERKRFVVRAAVAPAVTASKTLAERVTAAERDLAKIQDELAQLREGLRTHATHHEHGRKKVTAREKAAPVPWAHRQAVRDVGPCKTVRTSKQGTTTSSASAAVVCGSGSVEVG